MFLTQDIFYHVAGWYLPQPGDWADNPFGGFDMGFYIPGGYVALLVLAILFYYIENNFRKT